MNAPHIETAIRHFERPARTFPVMCASDEFHFPPRVAAAGRYYDRLESFEPEEIDEFIGAMKAFGKELNRSIGLANDLETAIDLELLRAHVAGFLIEMDQRRSWRHNPLLYLKDHFRSTRSSASFAAAFTADRDEKSFFYITTRLVGRSGRGARKFLKKRLHREYKFLSAFN